MSDLFDSLSARFTPATQPTIRPRPQSRFEGVQDTDAPVEEDSFETVRAPERPASQPAVQPARQPDKGRTSQAAQMRQQNSGSDATNTPDQSKPETPLTPMDRIETTQRAMPRDADAQSRPETPRTAPDAANEKPTDPPGRIAEVARSEVPPDPAPFEIMAQTEVANTENATPQSAPIETRIVETPAEAPQATQPPEARAEGYSIRIGRIEMRQPAPPPPPAPAPAPPPPRRAAPVAPNTMNGGARGGPNGSGLTDYLGWKRR